MKFHMTPPDPTLKLRVESPLQGRAAAVFRHDVLAVLALGLVIGLACRGHYAMPHTDFTEFVDCGHAWLRGELPPTLKRGPVYSLLVVGLGAWLPVEAGEAVVAEWLNAVLLPVSGLLVYLIGRRWFGPGARWAALWFLLLPLGMYCTAHIVLESLLTCLILLTLWAVQRNSAWAYVVAAMATLTRYDAAGLIVGVGLADWLRTRAAGRALLHTALAAAPLAALLVATGLTWSKQPADHYLMTIAEQPAFHWRASALLIVQAGFDPQLARLWGWLAPLEPALRQALLYGPLIFASLGAIWQVRNRDGAGVAALVGLASYMLVHAVYSLQFERFGYPLAPVFLLLVGVGLRSVAVHLGRVALLARVRSLLLLLVGLLLAAVLIHAAQALGGATGGSTQLAGRLALLGLLAAAVVWAAPLALRRRRLSQTVLLVGVAALLLTQVRTASALLGTGREMKNQVEAARWIRAQAGPEARVLCDLPGLLRLYVGRDPPDRFLGFEDLESQTWPEILAECRSRKIGYIIWHDVLWDVHGSRYGERMRLARFDHLARPENVPGVQVERRLPNFPNLVILRVVTESE